VTGSVLVVLLWIFLVGQVVLAGAEFTRVLTLRADAARSSASSAGGDGKSGAGPGEDAAADVDR
jgi:uncharacterized BrkB/YihY/UPF0761 family membrane protein